MISKYIDQAMEQSSWIRRMFEAGKEMKISYGADNVYDLSLGNPILEPPPEFFRVFQKIATNTSSGKHRYMSNAGFEDVREKVAQPDQERLVELVQALGNWLQIHAYRKIYQCPHCGRLSVSGHDCIYGCGVRPPTSARSGRRSRCACRWIPGGPRRPSGSRVYGISPR